ncbi:MAG: sialidase family protein [Armatimonadota bacterium]
MTFEDTLVAPVERGKYGPRGMPGDIIQLENGDLLIGYTSGGIGARKSADLGKTWSQEFTLLPDPSDPQRQGSYRHPSFLRMPDGDILMSYIYNAASLPYQAHNYYRRSADEGQTWSQQYCMTPHPSYCLMHNAKFLMTSDGRIIAPVEFKKRWPKSHDHSGYVSMVFYSDDDGYSWWPSENHVDVFPHECQEPDVVQLADARLMMLFRTYSGFMGRAYSADDGETWEDVELLRDMPLPPNASAITCDRLPGERNRDLLLIRCTTGDGHGRRNPLVAMLSRDNGRSWENPRIIAGDRSDDYGYQSVTFVDDLAVISYHARDGLHVARISTDWFYEEE